MGRNRRSGFPPSLLRATVYDAVLPSARVTAGGGPKKSSIEGRPLPLVCTTEALRTGTHDFAELPLFSDDHVLNLTQEMTMISMRV